MIVIAGKNDIAVWGLKRMIQTVGSANVAIVLNRTDNGVNGWQKSTRYFAEKWSIPIISLDDAEACADVFLSLEFDKIIKTKKFKTKKLYNIHFSYLPKYKGMYTSIWPILNGDRTSGVTLHLIDDGIDTGPILDQEHFAINTWTTSRDLYRDYTNCATRVLGRNIHNILTGDHSSRNQVESNSSYNSKSSIDFTKSHIDTKQTAETIVRFVRAFAFREYQFATFNGRAVVSAEILTSFQHSEIDQNITTIIKSIDFPVKLYFDCLDQFLTACKINDLATAIRLRNNISSTEDANEKGWTPLIVAAFHNSIDVVKYLVSIGANINASNSNGTTVLMYAKDAALRTNDLSVFNYLLTAGADPFLPDYHGRTLFQYLSIDQVRALGLNKLYELPNK